MIKEYLPRTDKEYLQVGRNTRDLYIRPAAEAKNGLPELYDSDGNLIVFAMKTVVPEESTPPKEEEKSDTGMSASKAVKLGIKSANAISNAQGEIGTIDHFLATKVRMESKTTLLADINAVKKEIYTEKIDYHTNETLSKTTYEVVEESNFVIKKGGTITEVSTSVEKRAKAFSDYFNVRDITTTSRKGIALARKSLFVLDFIQMSQTIYSMLPKESGASLEIPNPTDVASAFALVVQMAGKNAAGSAVGSMAFPITCLFTATNVIATQAVSEMMDTLMAPCEGKIANAKLKGLDTLRLYTQSQAAKLCGYELIEDIPQETHNLVMKGKINTLSDLDISRAEQLGEGTNNYYVYGVQKIQPQDRPDEVFIIDAIFIQ